MDHKPVCNDSCLPAPFYATTPQGTMQEPVPTIFGAYARRVTPPRPSRRARLISLIFPSGSNKGQTETNPGRSQTVFIVLPVVIAIIIFFGVITMLVINKSPSNQPQDLELIPVGTTGIITTTIFSAPTTHYASVGPRALETNTTNENTRGTRHTLSEVHQTSKGASRSHHAMITITEIPTTRVTTPMTTLQTPYTGNATTYCTTIIDSGTALPTSANGACGKVLITNLQAMKSQASISSATPSTVVDPVLALVTGVSLVWAMLCLSSESKSRLYAFGAAIVTGVLATGLRLAWAMAFDDDAAVGRAESIIVRIVVGLVLVAICTWIGKRTLVLLSASKLNAEEMDLNSQDFGSQMEI
ncbi:MAG: hypothetical protein M1822_008614 [Bathelium mastoideum]|nr:MAG: hypothetical protein M1822_008614 [Bathelium mastoideum]